MNIENTNNLVARYATVFKAPDIDISCNDGWFCLIDTFCWYVNCKYSFIKVLSIGKKNGRLKIYLNEYNDDLRSILEFIEFLSFGICEICGSTRNVDTVLNRDVAMTVCEKCKKGLKEIKTGVLPREGGKTSLFCYDCNTWIENTANYEMRKEGYFAHSHVCKKRNK